MISISDDKVAGGYFSSTTFKTEEVQEFYKITNQPKIVRNRPPKHFLNFAFSLN